MREKIVALFFHVISWAVWAACVCAVLYGLFLLFTGAAKSPDVTLRAARVADVVAEDLPEGADPAAWRAVDLDLTLRSDKRSPYTLEVEKLALRNAEDLGFLKDSFVLSAPLNFSRAKPQETTIRVYLHSASPDAAVSEALAGQLDLGLLAVHSRFGVVRLSLSGNKLHFTPVPETAE